MPLLMGAVLGIIFGASSLYLALKVGLTVSASIPVAVLSITLFRAFSRVLGVRRATILENNIVQTTGSAGESIAFGIAVTMPALLILGFEMEVGRIMLVAVLGSLLGVLMMIPLRYTLIVKGHKELRYPEGMACAEVLVSGERGGTTARTVFSGFFFGLIYKALNVGMNLWKDTVEAAFRFFPGASISSEVSPELLGVGYIIGFRNSAIMAGGGVLSWWVLIPMIKLFGSSQVEPLFPATKFIRDMSLTDVWKYYVLYIGAGAVTAGGFISLGQALPTIVRSAKAGIQSLQTAGKKVANVLRTERELPMPIVIVGCILIALAVWLAPSLHLPLLGAILLVAFAFLFVLVSSRICGEIGSSSNPVSGMTVATLLLTSLVFTAMGWVSPEHRVAALSVAAVVCVAAAVGGATSQDLKTGYLVGATPRAQQIGLLVGTLSSALVIGFTLILLNEASTVYSKKALPPGGAHVDNVASLPVMERPRGSEWASDTNLYHVLQLTSTPKTGPLSALPEGKYLVDDQGNVQYFVDPGINGTLKTRDNGNEVQKYAAPKARLMSLIIDGIMTRKLPWGLVLLGVAIAITLELCGVASLPFAVGVYLPMSTTVPIFVGGAVRALVDGYVSRKRKVSAEESESSPGVLFSSGLIAGGAISGILLAVVTLNEGLAKAFDFSHALGSIAASDVTSVVALAIMSTVLFAVGIGKLSGEKSA